MIERPGFEQAQFDSSAGGGSNFFPENGTITPETQERIDTLVETARVDAIERTNKSPEAIRRVENAIARRFKPYVEENEIIAQKISTPEFEADIAQTDAYLGGRVAAIMCDDGRITADQIGDPRLISVGRRLQGMPDVRGSTKKRGIPMIDDPEIVSSIKIYMDRQAKKGNLDPHVTEFVGPHIFSEHPTHGCGAEMAKIRAGGGTVEVGMWDGGINDYFDELGDGFEAFNNHIQRLGGTGATFDTTHDAYTQGLIFGLRDARSEFDRSKPLRQNLLEMQHSGKILMTEHLDSALYQRVSLMARNLGFHEDIDLNDIVHFGINMMLISKIAREVTQQEEERGFNWIPDNLKDGKDERAVRALGYVSVRNVVRRILANIKRGDHDLVDHTEQVIAMGPIRADYNKKVIPFIHHTPRGKYTSEDFSDAAKLNGLLESSLRSYHKVDFTTEGRVIMPTGVYDRSRYLNDEIASEAMEEENSYVGNNAAKLRDMFEKGVDSGEVIITGVLHEPKTRRMTHVVK